VFYHTWPRRFSASRLALALWLCGSCVQCSPPLPASEAEAPLSTNVLSTLSQHLQKADALLATLEAGLKTRSEQVANLQRSLDEAGMTLDALRNELTTLRENLDASETTRGRLAEDLREMGISLAELTKRYEALSQSWSVYREAAEAREALLDRRVRGWRTAAIAGTVGALAVGFLLGVMAH
jgi:chromosome segregation ATPase